MHKTRLRKGGYDVEMCRIRAKAGNVNAQTTLKMEQTDNLENVKETIWAKKVPTKMPRI
jgi:hypothetical protein